MDRIFRGWFFDPTAPIVTLAHLVLAIVALTWLLAGCSPEWINCKEGKSSGAESAKHLKDCPR